MIKLPPEIEEEIAKESQKDVSGLGFRRGAHFGASLMLKKVLEDLRSEEVDKFADNYFGYNNCLPEPTQLADWLEQRYAKKESEGE